MEKNKNSSSARLKLGNAAENSERDEIALDLKLNYIDLIFKLKNWSLLQDKLSKLAIKKQGCHHMIIFALNY